MQPDVFWQQFVFVWLYHKLREELFLSSHLYSLLPISWPLWNPMTCFLSMCSSDFSNISCKCNLTVSNICASVTFLSVSHDTGCVNSSPLCVANGVPVCRHRTIWSCIHQSLGVSSFSLVWMNLPALTIMVRVLCLLHLFLLLGKQVTWP